MATILNSDQKTILECTDHHDKTGISLFHYKPGVQYNSVGDGVLDCGRMRGVVVNADSEIVYEFFPKHAAEWAAGDETNRPTDVELSEYDAFLAVEGALLRLFYYGDQWFLSTNRRLDAFQSRWSSKYSFGDMFEYTLKYMFPDKEHHVVEYFCSHLDKSLQYMFLIRFNNDNRIVCHVHNVDLPDRLLFVGTFSGYGSILQHAHDAYLDHPVLSKLGRQKKLCTPCTTLEQWEDFVVNTIDPYKNPGIIFIHKTMNRQMKLVHPVYAECVRLRGNQPNLALRYLELRSDKEQLLRFCQLYDRSMRLFNQIEETLQEMARRINFWYTERYVHNRFVSVPFPEYNIMKKCHQWYLEDASNRRVYIRVVVDFLNRESPLFLYRMMNRIRREHHNNTHDVPFRPPTTRKPLLTKSIASQPVVPVVATPPEDDPSHNGQECVNPSSG